MSITLDPFYLRPTTIIEILHDLHAAEDAAERHQTYNYLREYLMGLTGQDFLDNVQTHEARS